MKLYVPTFLSFKIFSSEKLSLEMLSSEKQSSLFLRCSDEETYQADVGDERANL